MSAQYFPQALGARLGSITALTAIVGNSIYKTFIPLTHNIVAGEPALTYIIPSNPKGHVLGGSDGTSIANVELHAWCQDTPTTNGVATTFQILEAIRNGIDGIPGTWGDGTCVIMSVVQQDDTDNDEQPKAGSDQPLRHLFSEYAIKYRVTIPTLS